MKRDEWRVQQRVENAWNDATYRLQQISQATIIHPKSSSQIISLDDSAPTGVVKLTIAPVVFNLNERPNQSRANLFIVVNGWLSFQTVDLKEKPLLTADYGTEVGYFRSKPKQLDHIFGVHYDMDERDYRHPVFHGQLASRAEFGDYIRKHFHRDCEIVDHMSKVLHTARIPTAQMDVFSVLTQICADHLIGPKPTKHVTGAFRQMRTACDFFLDAAHGMPFLSREQAASCYRAIHWYN